MKNTIMFFLIILNFKTYCQIEKIDTLINVDLNLSTIDIILDLDKDGTDDLLFQNFNNTTLLKGQNGTIEMVLDNPNLSYNQTHVGECANNNIYSFYYHTYLIHTTVSSLNISTGNNIIPLKLWVYNVPTSTFEAKYILLKVFRSFITSKYTITGWYINHTINTPLSCDLTYNDSIITSYNNNNNVDTTSKLPVELVDFTINKNRNKIQLNWQTASEENNKGFEVQRSYDGIDFEIIGFVAGNGTIFEYSNYSFIDESPINGTNYYKLKQIDYNGDFEYTDIKSIEFLKTVEKGEITPNPASDKLFFQGIEGEIKIYNSIGKLMITVNDVNKNDYVDISSLNSGNYYVVNNEIVYTFLVIK